MSGILFSTVSEALFSDDFGFTESEVDELYSRYLQKQPEPMVTREGLREWYDEIFSAMVVYGFLSYENGYVRIPDKELMDKFRDMMLKEPSIG